MSEKKMKCLEQVLEAAIAKGQLAGANLLICRDGKEVHYSESGYADMEKKRPYRRDTIFRLYSMSKPITAAAAMLLLERGLLDPGQPLEEILPGFRNVKVCENGAWVPARRSVVVHDLLAMTSGLPYGGDVMNAASMAAEQVFQEIIAGLYTDQKLGTVEVANRLGQCGLAFHPGDSWRYGTSADVLGAVIECVSGKRFGDFLREELFEPLGMKDTAFYVPEEKRDRLACVYEETPQGLVLCPTNNLGIMYTQEKRPAFESGGAGLVSTIDDYAKFAGMLMQGGICDGKRILAEDTVKYFTGGRLTPWQQEAMWRGWDGLSGYTYGNLLRVMVEPGMAYYQTWKDEYGWDGWLGPYFCNSPKNGMTILMSFQRKDSGVIEVTRKLRDVLAAVWREL